MDTEFVFMDGNTRPHHANIVNECLQSMVVTCMKLSAFSLDLNQRRHVWYKLDRRVATRQLPPTCVLEFWRAFLD